MPAEVRAEMPVAPANPYLVRGQVHSGFVKPFSKKTPPAAERQTRQPSSAGRFTDTQNFERCTRMRLYTPDFRKSKRVYEGWKCIYLLDGVMWTCITTTEPTAGMVSCTATNRHIIEFVKMHVPATDPHVLWNAYEDAELKKI